jgi:hypothetical protein
MLAKIIECQTHLILLKSKAKGSFFSYLMALETVLMYSQQLVRIWTFQIWSSQQALNVPGGSPQKNLTQESVNKRYNAMGFTHFFCMCGHVCTFKFYILKSYQQIASIIATDHNLYLILFHTIKFLF